MSEVKVMADIVDRLKYAYHTAELPNAVVHVYDVKLAIDEIEQLRATLQKCREEAMEECATLVAGGHSEKVSIPWFHGYNAACRNNAEAIRERAAKEKENATT